MTRLAPLSARRWREARAHDCPPRSPACGQCCPTSTTSRCRYRRSRPRRHSPSRPIPAKSPRPPSVAWGFPLSEPPVGFEPTTYALQERSGWESSLISSGSERPPTRSPGAAEHRLKERLASSGAPWQVFPEPALPQVLRRIPSSFPACPRPSVHVLSTDSPRTPPPPECGLAPEGEPKFPQVSPTLPFAGPTLRIRARHA